MCLFGCGTGGDVGDFTFTLYAATPEVSPTFKVAQRLTFAMLSLALVVPERRSGGGFCPTSLNPCITVLLTSGVVLDQHTAKHSLPLQPSFWEGCLYAGEDVQAARFWG